MDVKCDYCGGPAEFVDSAKIYGKSYGMIYNCQTCKAWVGVHKGTDRPLGRLANAPLRKWKRHAHEAFDPLWKSGDMTRRDAYYWLSKELHIPFTKCHIGMFGIATCRRVVEVCNPQAECLEGEEVRGRDDWKYRSTMRPEWLR